MSDCRPDSRSYDSNKTIVDTYLRDKAAGEDAYLRFYRIQRSLAAAVEKSAMAELPSGKRFSHQRRIPRATLLAAKTALMAVDFSVCTSFDELYDLVAATIGPIPGVGELTIYDTAHRLGAYLQLSPKFVYVHAGVRAGLPQAEPAEIMRAQGPRQSLLRGRTANDTVQPFRKRGIHNA